MREIFYTIVCFTAQKMKFYIVDFFSKWDQIRSFLQTWSLVPKKSVMENFSFLWSVLTVVCEIVLRIGSTGCLFNWEPIVLEYFNKSKHSMWSISHLLLKHVEISLKNWIKKLFCSFFFCPDLIGKGGSFVLSGHQYFLLNRISCWLIHFFS